MTSRVSSKPRVIIAGATGFVGQHLAAALSGDNHVIGLTRLTKPGTAGGVHEWRGCELLSLDSARAAIRDADVAYYLVHSMMPSARLSQGDFWDFDLVAADNFARAAHEAGVKQIIYLGGLVPRMEVRSKHLASRFEVEQALRAHPVPVTTLRAGLVIGPEGSSFLTMVRIIRALPVLLFPRTTHTLTHPIAVADVIRLLMFCLGRSETFGQTYDVGGPELMSYRSMVEHTARALQLERFRISIPIRGARWLQLFGTPMTGAPRELLEPLIDSMRYPMVARDRRLNQLAGIRGTPFLEAVTDAIKQMDSAAKERSFTPVAFQRGRASDGISRVRSIQRLPLPSGWTGPAVGREFWKWMARKYRAVLRIELKESGQVWISVRGFPSLPLLVLQECGGCECSSPDMIVFRVKGGLVVGKGGSPRLEFRTALGGSCLLAMVQDYIPRLPWYLYRWTQAQIHLATMNAFGRYLRKLG